MANEDEFADLQDGLAYDSDDDVDEAIQKEFDYLVSLGKLPAPILVKVEENGTNEENSNGSLLVATDADSPTVLPSENSQLMVTNVNNNETSNESSTGSENDTAEKDMESVGSNGRMADANKTCVSNVVRPKKEPNDSTAASPSPSGNSSSNFRTSNSFHIVGGYFEMIQEVRIQ